MVTLYMSRTCPFSRNVIEAAIPLGVALELKDITDPEIEAELLRLGGEKQTPYFIDTKHDVAMYDSDAIIRYLHKTFGKTG